MIYNAEKILSILSETSLNINNEFHEGKNDYLLLELRDKIFHGLYDYANGISKFVIIPIKDKYDYVIKIPYTGSYNFESGWYSGSRNQYYHRGYEDYWAFEGGTYEDRPWDYCAIEVQNYNVASLKGFSDCLAKTELIGFVRGYPIYVQEKCETLRSCSRSHSHSIEEISDFKYSHSWSNIPCDWLIDFKSYFGENKLNHFLQFLEDVNWNDLRDENIGYIKNRPVLIDYSDFLE